MCHTCLVFNSKLWVIAGISKDTGEYSSPVYRNDVWSSLDGITWTVATATAAFQARGGHSSVVFGGKMWVIGGTTFWTAYKNDVWSSADGIAWTQETGAAAFSARMNHASLVAQSKIWVIGGDNGGTLSDVWSSPDGITWSSVSGSAEFGARGSPIALDYDNRLWILGGNSRTDAWYSGNGSFWTKVDPDPGFGNAQLTDQTGSPPMRLYSGPAGTVHNGKMFEVGGDSLGDDVWYSQ